jgi:hypothetical protein
MAHTIVPAKHPHIALIRITGDLTSEDMTCDSELGLGTGKPIFVICDVLNMNMHFPDAFVDSARTGFLVNPDLQHLAVVTKSKLIRSVGLAAAALSARRDKMSMHDSEVDAEAYLLGMIKRRGL